jgi:hypothetical protein
MIQIGAFFFVAQASLKWSGLGWVQRNEEERARMTCNASCSLFVQVF